MTPHIEAKKEEIAKIVIMPGDPLRTKFIAEKYLENYKLVNQVRNILAYTGFYKGKEVTIMASGMGIPSMGIYSYELYKFYNVETIIRIGSCGAYTDKLNLYDLILVNESLSMSTYAQIQNGYSDNIINSSLKVNNKIKETALKNNINLNIGRIHCSDVFYKEDSEVNKYYDEFNCLGVEMETFSLFHNANLFGKSAACLLTVSDNLVTRAETTALERQESFTKMIELALNSIL